mgnify:CR=1 FL=1
MQVILQIQAAVFGNISVCRFFLTFYILKYASSYLVNLKQLIQLNSMVRTLIG